jgi:hypothetical protein
LHQTNKRQKWYTPLVGTIGIVMAHRFSSCAADGPSTWTVTDVARTFGLHPTPSRVLHVLDRLDRFGIARRSHTLIAVRLTLVPLTRRQLAQLPAYLRAAYEAR